MRIYIFRLKQLAFLLFLTLSLMLGIIILTVLRMNAQNAFVGGFIYPSAVIDPGHGGIDGGTVSASGLAEAPVNLAISFKTRDILRFLGVVSVMTREDENSLDYDESNTVSQNKSADLKARLTISQNLPDCDFLSIHLNKFEQSEYKGAQVFYSSNNEASFLLAECLQQSMRLGLDPSNERKAKESPDSVYLMKNIRSPAVTIECGFLSNPSEAELLASDRYQTKVAAAVCCGYIDYLEKSDD